MSDLEIVPEDWDRALAVVAHPDDMEYGASSAVAKWTAQGKQIGYVLATRGEAGISSMKPEEVSRLRSEEQRLACEVVGVDDLVFLDHWKDLYKRDLNIIEERGLLKPGSIVVADNVGDVFNPVEYLTYVRECGHYHTQNLTATIEYTNAPDAVEPYARPGTPDEEAEVVMARLNRPKSKRAGDKRKK